MLQTERNADYRKTQERSECKMNRCDLDTSHEDPDHIHYDRQTASVIGIRLYLMAERPESESRQLDELKTERDTDYRDAEQQTYDKVVKADKEAAKYKPKDVS
jgi:hypothetical protein